MSDNIVYSTDGEFFNYDDFSEAAESANGEVGEITSVYKGESYSPDISDLVCAASVIEHAEETMYGRHGEFSEGWLSDSTPEQDRELEEELNEVLEKWIVKHNLEPSFYGVKNVKKIKVKILDKQGDFEVISNESECLI